jgi:hypothetical protein
MVVCEFPILFEYDLRKNEHDKRCDYRGIHTGNTIRMGLKYRYDLDSYYGLISETYPCVPFNVNKNKNWEKMESAMVEIRGVAHRVITKYETVHHLIDRKPRYYADYDCTREIKKIKEENYLTLKRRNRYYNSRDFKDRSWRRISKREKLGRQKKTSRRNRKVMDERRWRMDH